MKLPGFTAENALGKASKVYWSHPVAISALGNRSSGIVPAQAETHYAEADEMEDDAEQHAGEEDHNETGSEHDGSDADGLDDGSDADGLDDGQVDTADASDDSDESDEAEVAEG
jgi:hypothetical protein